MITFMAQDRGDRTAAIQAALNSGGPARLGPGVHRVRTLSLPPAPACATLVGDGMGATILEAIDPAAPILAARNGRAMGCRVADLTFRAPAGGSKAAAVDLAGVNASDFERIRLVGAWDVGVRLCSAPGGCYGNTLRRLVVERNVGPRVVVLAANAGAAATNPNANRIHDLWVYGVRGCEAVLDLADSTLTSVVGGLIEQVPGGAAVVPGNCTMLEGLWIEDVDAPLRVAEGRGLTPNWLTVRDCYFSGAPEVAMPARARGWKIEGTSQATVKFRPAPPRDAAPGAKP